MSLSRKLIIADSCNPDTSEQVIQIQGTDHGLPSANPAPLNDRDIWKGTDPPFQVVNQGLDASLERVFCFALQREGLIVLFMLSRPALNSGFSCFSLLKLLCEVRGQLSGSRFWLFRVGSRNQTQVLRLAQQVLFLPSHPAGPRGATLAYCQL